MICKEERDSEQASWTSFRSRKRKMKRDLNIYRCPNCNFWNDWVRWHVESDLRECALSKHEKSHDGDTSVHQNTYNKTARRRKTLPKLVENAIKLWEIIIWLLPYYKCFSELSFISHRLINIWKHRMPRIAESINTDCKWDSVPVNQFSTLTKADITKSPEKK